MELMKLGELRAYHEDDIVEVVKILKDNGYSVVDEYIESEYKRFHIMKNNECEKNSTKSVKRTWSDWDFDEISFTDINGKIKTGIYHYRNNGKKVQVKCGDFKAEATCCKDDVFDFEKGLALAKSRLIVKYLDNQVKSIAKAM